MNPPFIAIGLRGDTWSHPFQYAHKMPRGTIRSPKERERERERGREREGGRDLCALDLWAHISRVIINFHTHICFCILFSILEHSNGPKKIWKVDAFTSFFYFFDNVDYRLRWSGPKYVSVWKLRIGLFQAWLVLLLSCYCVVLGL